MQDTSAAKELLMNLIDECPKCYRYFLENVPMIVDEGDALTEAQSEAILIDLTKRHKKH